MPVVPSSSVNPNTFPFNIANDNSVTSAGVYNSANVLVRTLWNNKVFNSGSHSAPWDGKDDMGNLQTIGAYVMKVVSNKIVYTWEGTVGNNSTFNTGPSKWASYGATLSDMVNVGNFMYCTMWFSEYTAGQMKFNKSTPNQQANLNPGFTAGQASLFTCANGTYVFYGGNSYDHGHNYVFATNVSNDATATFSVGVVETPPVGRVYNSVLDRNILGATGIITGMAVQQSGSQYIFVAHAAQNLINVYQTSGGTGTFIRSISITAPCNLEFEGDGVLWIGQGTTVTKYTVNTNGTITITGSQIAGFSRVAGISVFNGDLCVLDAGNQQVVKRYNSTTLSSTGTIGATGGYATSPTVANNKFYLEDAYNKYYTFVRHQSDGSIWVGDPGNCRYQHFDSGGTYINNIMFLQQQYNCNVCLNQPTAVFSDFLEYTVDYTQSLSSGWVLANNWGYGQPTPMDPKLPINEVILMSNNRRYAIFRTKTNLYYFGELTSSGVRYITATALPGNARVDASGNMFINNSSGSFPTQSTTYLKYSLIGFDGSNNPLYSIASTYANVPLGNSGYPSSGTFTITSSGNIVIFNPLNNTLGGGSKKLFHLSGYNVGNSKMQWRACPENFTGYTGDFPTDGTFDIGNLVGFPGSEANAIGNHVFFGYHGEFWKNSETGIIEHFNDEGLMLGMCGVVGPQVLNQAAPAGYAGNSLNVKPVAIGSDIYIYASDEEHHSGLHRWKVTGLNTINTEVINFVLVTSAYAPTVTQIDLLAGLPENGVVTGTPGWTQFPAANFFVNSTNQFTNVTRRAQIDLNKSPDIIVTAGGNLTTTPYSLKRALPVAAHLSSWSITGILDLSLASFKSNTTSSSTPWANYIEVLDVSGKVIAQILPVRSLQMVLNKAIFGPYNANPVYGSSPFVIAMNGSQVFFGIFLFGVWLYSTQPKFDLTADITSPATLGCFFTFGSGQSTQAQFGIIELFIDAH